MQFKIFFIGLILLLVGCGEVIRDEDKLPSKYQSDNIKHISEQIISTEGIELYKKCAGCHGKYGEKNALGKSDIIANLSNNQIVSRLNSYKNGTRSKHEMGGLMKGQIVRYSSQEIQLVANYINRLKPIQLKDGKAIYKHCASCHGETGRTVALGKSDLIGTWSANEVVSALVGYQKGKRNTYGLGQTMTEQIHLKDYDINDFNTVAVYIESMNY